MINDPVLIISVVGIAIILMAIAGILINHQMEKYKFDFFYSVCAIAVVTIAFTLVYFLDNPPSGFYLASWR